MSDENMTVLINEVFDTTDLILEAQWNVTHFEAMQIAVQLQYNKILLEGNEINLFEK